MASNFGNILNLIIFLVLTAGWAFYAFQMIFGTRAFFDRFICVFTLVAVNVSS